jgi:hypothetical protein
MSLLNEVYNKYNLSVCSIYVFISSTSLGGFIITNVKYCVVDIRRLEK